MFAADSLDPLMQPTMQYGAFGLCLVLCGMLAWQMRSAAAQSKDVLDVLRETSRVITLNTTAIQTVGDSVAQHDVAASKRHDDSQQAFYSLRDHVRDLATQAPEGT